MTTNIFQHKWQTSTLPEIKSQLAQTFSGSIITPMAQDILDTNQDIFDTFININAEFLHQNRDYVADLNIVKHIVTAAYETERSYPDSVILYHGQESTYRVLDDAHRLAAARKLRLSTRCDESAAIIKRYGIFSRLYNNDIVVSENNYPREKNTLSVNYSLLSNLSLMGESTLNYIMRNFSQTSALDYVDGIPYTSLNEREQIYDLIQQTYDRDTELMLPGRLVLFIVPVQKLDSVCYNSLPGGIPNKPVSSSQFISTISTALLGRVNNSQARIYNFDDDVAIKIVGDDDSHLQQLRELYA